MTTVAGSAPQRRAGAAAIGAPSGLGLDIARRCAEATGGSMTVGRAASGGALISLILKAATA